ncbi:PEP-utilizing enzyme [Actinomadura algeriensis]|uniref:PEP-utilizing enzyme n=1 Tax=Actinomadura algeriensis TaxID=1679523 RepID=UPI00384F68E4
MAAAEPPGDGARPAPAARRRPARPRPGRRDPPLSHLAILARETGVPTVVGLRGAVDRFPPGTRLLVDGDGGRVEALGARAGEESVA